MVELSDADRAELERLRETIGDFDLPDRPRIAGEFGPIDPMLAETLDAPFDGIDEADWIAETKYDGTRVIAEKFDGEVRLYTRRGVDRADDVPAVTADLSIAPDDVIVDGELTHLDPNGTSTFLPIHTAPETLEARELTPVLFCFDVLYVDEDLTRLRLLDRKERLDATVTETDHVAVAPFRTAAFGAFFRAVTDAGEEGLVIKRRDSQYYPGVRSAEWLKVKQFTERDAIVVGYTEGEGNRRGTFGSLVLTDGERCLGRVGSGFTEAELEALSDAFEETDERPVTEAAAGAPYTPVEPFVVQVRYQELTREGKLRAPVFVRIRPEKPLDDVQPVGNGTYRE